MLFNSLLFAAFFPVVYSAYLLLEHRKQNVLLLVASYAFYAAWDIRFVSLILISTLVDFTCARRIESSASARAKRALLLISITTNLGLLGIFKYFGFFADNFVRLLSAFGLQVDTLTIEILLPVGISFYTFQTMGYTIDVYRNRIPAERDPLCFALFVAFFPQLVAGPIERAQRLLPQLRARRTVTRANLASGFWLIAWGFFLKVFVADNLAPIVDAVFANENPTGYATLLAVYAFAFQLLGDFAGYSSIAIGLAQLLGIELSTNFRFPYFVSNPQKFWRHWHISLSEWLRDYLYISLGGNRVTNLQMSRNLLLTMTLGGLWHGASWTFVAWGVYHGLLLIAHRATVSFFAARTSPTYEPSWLVHGIKVVGMFHLTCVGYIFFRAQSIDGAVTMFASLASIGRALTTQEVAWALELVFYAGPMLLVTWMQMRRGDVRTIGGIPPALRVPAVVGVFYALVVWGNWGGPEFYYFRF